MDDLKYYNYHRLVSHLVEQCIALKDKIMELAHQGKSDLEEDVATSKFMLETYQILSKEINLAYTIQFGSFDSIEVNFIQLVSFQVSQIQNNIQELIMVDL